MAKRAVVRREQTLFFNAVLRLFRDGYITRTRARELVEEGWGSGPNGAAFLDPVIARMRAMDMQVEYGQKQMAAGAVGRMHAKGLYSDTKVIASLVSLGMDPDKALARMVQSKLGLLPARRLELPETDEDESPDLVGVQ